MWVGLAVLGLGGVVAGAVRVICQGVRWKRSILPLVWDPYVVCQAAAGSFVAGWGS